MKYITNIDLAQNELQNAKIQNLATAPASPVKGQMYFNTTDNHLYVYDGTAWDALDNPTITFPVTSVGVTTPIANTGTASAPVIGHIDSAVTPGTYTKLTVDAKGHVTAGATATPADIGAATSGHNHAGVYQPIDADLTAIAALAGTSGLLKKTAADTWALDTNTYLTANQTITLTGDVTGSGNGSFATTLKDVGAAGTYTKVTTDAKGRVISGTTLAAGDIPSLSYLPLAGGTMTGDITLKGDPTSALHPATKQYVDSIAAGLDPKASVRLASTGNVVIATGGLQTIDGIVTVAGNRVLLKNQTTTTENGIYIVAAGAWTRALDFDGNPSTEISGGAFTFVEEGSTLQDTGWVCSCNGAVTVGTTPITFTQFSSAGIISTDATLSKVGNTIGMPTVATAGTYRSVTVDAQGRVTAGTNPTTIAAYGLTDAAAVTHTHTLTAAGDVTSVATTIDNSADTITLTLPNIVTAGTNCKITYNAKGQVTAGAALAVTDIPAAAKALRYSADVAAGTSVAITHSLATTDVVVMVREKATGAAIICDITVTDANTVTLGFASNAVASFYRVTVLA